MLGYRALIASSSKASIWPQAMCMRMFSTQLDPLGQKLAQKKAGQGPDKPLYATKNDYQRNVQDSRFQGATDTDSGQIPTKWQRRFLVLTRLYKSSNDIPQYVHNGTMNRMHDRMRVVFIIFASLLFFSCFYISEAINAARISRDRKAGVVVSKM